MCWRAVKQKSNQKTLREEEDVLVRDGFGATSPGTDGPRRSTTAKAFGTPRPIPWIRPDLKNWPRQFRMLLRARLGTRKTGLSPPVFLYWPFQGGTSVVVPYCYLFLLSVFILWFSYYVSDIFCKFKVAEWPPIWERAVHSVYRECFS